MYALSVHCVVPAEGSLLSSLSQTSTYTYLYTKRSSRKCCYDGNVSRLSRVCLSVCV